MAHNNGPIDNLESGSDAEAIIAKINEIIEHLNHMWYPDSTTNSKGNAHHK